MTDKDYQTEYEEQVPYMLTGNQVCEIWGICKMTLSRLCKRGLKSVKIGGTRRYLVSDLEEYVMKMRE